MEASRHASQMRERKERSGTEASMHLYGCKCKGITPEEEYEEIEEIEEHEESHRLCLLDFLELFELFVFFLSGHPSTVC